VDIYNYSDYKTFLREALREKKQQVSASFTYDRMAKACGIQKTYLSRVLNSDDSHLSEDQLYLAASYLGISREEHHYLDLLRAYQKSQSAKYRASLEKEIELLRQANDRTDSHLKAEKIPVLGDYSPYYLDPNVMLVHIFLAVERFRKNLKLLARQLDLSEEYFSEILTKLEQMKLITLSDAGYVLLKDSTHLPIDSPLYGPYRFMQRIKSLEKIQRLPKGRTYNFTAVFSADEQVRKKIQTKFLEMLEYIEKIATNAPDQEVYQINFDLFDWSI